MIRRQLPWSGPADTPLELEILGSLMRRMPTGIRKFAWWWERMYRAMGGGRFDETIRPSFP